MTSSKLAPLALLGLGGALHAQVALRFADGVLGRAVYSNVYGTPGMIFGVAPSTNAGPTRLALFDPGNPGVLGVGTDLLPLWKTGVLDAQGFGQLAYGLPADPSLAGVVLHIQAVSAPGATTLIDAVSNAVRLELGLQGESLGTFEAPHVRRRLHGGTALLDGRVLLAGGVEPASLGGAPFVRADMELYDGQVGAFLGPLPMPVARAVHTQTLLDDGRVLLLGGVGNGLGALAGGHVFDPETLAFTQVPAMAGGRVLHTATKLADGRVFVAGGSAGYVVKHPIGFGPGGSLAAPGPLQTQIYNPASNTWSPGPVLAVARTAHQAVLLANGKVLITGGVLLSGGGAPETTATALFYNPTTNALEPAGVLSRPVAFHAAVGTQAGGALLAGGGFVNPAETQFTPIDRSFLFEGGLFLDRPPVAGGVVGPGGQTICICVRPIPIGTGGPIGTDAADLPCVSDITYAFAGGVTDLELMTGEAQSSDGYYATDASVTSWQPVGELLGERFLPTFVPELDGARVTAFGGEVGGAPSSELWLVQY